MVVSGSLAYVVRTIKYSGRAEERMEQAERINKKQAKDIKRLKKTNARNEREQAKAADRVNAAAKEAVAKKSAIDEIPRQDEVVVCPINCRLP